MPLAATRTHFRCRWVAALLWLVVCSACGGGSGDSGAVEVFGIDRMSLNGTWSIAEGDAGDTPPSSFERTVPVPGFVDQARPAFAEVGVPSSRRAAFWYRREIDVPPDAGPIAILKVHKAQFGVAAWVNGVAVGSHLGAFTLAEMDVSDAIVRGGRNTIVIRVGADRQSVPASVPIGEDREKQLWLPGLWDDVAIDFSGQQRIVRVKIEPRIDRDEAVVITTIANHAEGAVDIEVEQRARSSNDGAIASDPQILRARVQPGENTLTQVVSLPGARWWSPEDPFLYAMSSRVRSGGVTSDELQTRFGMRSVEWRSGAQRGFFLNGERYYLRGSNISLHRFFEDPARGSLPWDRQWVRELLSEHPKRLHWNSMRVSIGRLPNFWYDLADEIGILLADEFMMWSLVRESRSWSLDEMEREYRAWVQENWNHPSIGWWDASNETDDPKSTAVVARVRDLDPTRQWENGGHNPPQGPNDPIEEHAYVLYGLLDLNALRLGEWQAPVAPATAVAAGHPYILNEYNLLWLQRTGEPFAFNAPIYARVARMDRGPYDADEYREAYAYIGAVLTEFWRASRIYAGVQHFTYITSSPVTGDNFLDVGSLTMEPRWALYAADAFAPVGMYLDFHDAPAADTAIVPLRLINDLGEPVMVDVELFAVDVEGTVHARSVARDIEIGPLGDSEHVLIIDVPAVDRWVLYGKVAPHDAVIPEAWSRRKFGFDHLGEAIPDPPFEVNP